MSEEFGAVAKESIAGGSFPVVSDIGGRWRLRRLIQGDGDQVVSPPPPADAT